MLRRLFIPTALACLAALVAAACQKDFTPGSVLTTVRVLAVKSEPAEAAPGETTQLTALVATVDGDVSQVTVDWALCLAARSADQVGSSPEACSDPAPDPANFAQAVTGYDVASSYALTIPDAATLAGSAANALSLPDATGGIYLSVRVVAYLPGSDASTAIYRQRVDLLGLPPNQNPVIDESKLLLNGKPFGPDLTSLDSSDATVTLEAHWTDASVEAYSVPAFGVAGGAATQANEIPRFSWYVTRGSIDPDHTGSGDDLTTKWTLESAPNGAIPGEPALLWLVLQDDRGGAAWVARSVVISPEN